MSQSDSPDKNCITLGNGDCVSENCMHTQPEPLTCSEVVERLPIVLVGDPVLREVARPVTGDEQGLVDLLCRTMKGAHALGLAAPQIGVSKRVAVIQMSEDDSATVLINPRIIDRLGEEIADEGCLSIPDVRLPIKRWHTISVESNGALIGTFRGLMARAIQHEVDHLDGILITDRVKELHSWRERRVQELEEQIAKHSGCSHCADSASGGIDK